MKAVAILVIMGWSTLCLANGGGYGSGVNIQGNPSSGALEHNKFVPVNLQKIEMQTEDLEIELYATTALVRVRYDFFNPAEQTAALAAFPCVALKSEMDDDPNNAKLATFTDFTIKADDQPLAYTVRSGDAPKAKGIQEDLDIKIPKWYTFRLDFGPKQHRVLTVSYRASYGQYTETVSDTADVFPNTLTYLFSTAAIWKGSIGKGHVSIKAIGVNPDDVRIRGGKVGRFKHSAKDTWTWDFVDFKPTFSDDIAIETSPEIRTYSSTYGKDQDRVEGGDYISTNGHWKFELTDFKVTASSTLAGGDYKPDNINKWSADTDPNSSWSEGVPGNGEGQWVEIAATVPVLLDTVEITNGLTASQSLFRANNRIKKLDLSVNGGEPQSVELPDQMDPFDIKLPDSKEPVRTIRLTIREVYQGTKYPDTCISRVRLFRHLTKEPEINPVR
jgi:Domain of unknown function (DUF4424)